MFFKARDFINKEKIYMLMLCFILLFNALIIFSEKVPLPQETFLKKRAFAPSLSAGEGEAKYASLAQKGILWDRVLEKKRHIFIFVNILGLLVFFVFSLGLFLDIRILMAKVKKREILKATVEHLRVSWGIRDIFKLAIIFLFFSYLLHIIQAHFLLSVSEESSARAFLPLLNTGIMDLLILGFIIYFVKVKYSQELAAIGLKIKDAARFIFLAVLGYIAFLPILASILLLLIWLANLFNYQPPQQALLKLFLQERRIWFLIYSTLMVAIIGPIVEEIFFRGFAYNAIKRRWGRSKAMALTAVVFAGLHATLIGFLPIMALGLLLAYAYEKTGSLISSITIHILHNGLMVALLFLGRYFIYLFEGGV